MSAQNTQALLCHPASPCVGVSAVEVAVNLAAGGDLALCYRLLAAPAALRLPSPRPPAFADGLWQHTCCELFVAVDAKKYREFNFSPSGEWAVYDFAGYRERIESAVPVAPQISLTQASDAVELRVLVPAVLLPPGPALQLGLTAVLEAADGSKTYWALAHCAAQPDFHQRQSFALTLKAS